MQLSGAKTKKETVNVALRELLRHGAHGAMSAADLLVCATAAQHDLVLLHDDADFVTAARYLSDVRERSIIDTPEVG
jgi:predicted nucleic acid-binding protein